MKNQYKDQLSSITAGEQFKQSLKDMMAKEFANQATTIITNENKFNWSKYSRYISCAACIAMILATVGVTVAINSGFRTKSMDDSAPESENMYMLESSNANDYNTVENNESIEPEIDTPVESDDAILEEEIEEDIATDERIGDDTVAAEEETEDAIEELPSEFEDPMTNSELTSKSIYAPENYDGEYFAEDYVYMTEGSGDIEALSIWDASNKSISYNSVCDDILMGYDEVGFVKFDVLEIVNADEANVIASNDSFSSDSTMYRVEMIYDYLTNDSADGETYVSLYGNELIQERGLPMFEVGDTILSAVHHNGSYYEIIEQLVYEVHRVNGVDVAYHHVYDNVDPGYTDMGLLEMEASLITSTSNNPAEYVHKASVKELTRYIRRNFKKREIVFADLTLVTTEFEPIEETPEIPDESTQGEVIVDDPIQEGGLSIPSENVIIKLSNLEVGIGTSGNSLISVSINSQLTKDDNGMAIMVIGENKLYFDSDSYYNGRVSKIEVNQSGTVYPISVNGFSVGADWEDVAANLAIDLSLENNQVCDIDVISGDDMLYRLTYVVENGYVSQIIINGII